MSGLSLWLSPPSPSPLEPYLETLSKRLSTVRFNPHVTLLSDHIVPSLPIPEVLTKISEAVKTWRTSLKEGEELDLEFQDVRKGALYYQCVLIALTETPALFSLHESLLTSFSKPIPSPPTYFPHLSLIYADLTLKRKDEIIEEMKTLGEVKQEEVEKVEVVGIKGFRPVEILLVRTKGPPETWEVLGKVALS